METLRRIEAQAKDAERKNRVHRQLSLVTVQFIACSTLIILLGYPRNTPVTHSYHPYNTLPTSYQYSLAPSGYFSHRGFSHRCDFLSGNRSICESEPGAHVPRGQECYTNVVWILLICSDGYDATLLPICGLSTTRSFSHATLADFYVFTIGRLRLLAVHSPELPLQCDRVD
jgi:hypothetical protein